MDIDWGGQGPASMPSGNSCGQLGTDKCAMITGSGNSVSANGVSGMGTTFVNTIDISDLNIKHGGQTNYSIKVDKQDASDSIYMHITGKDGSTNVFSGTDILSASGTASGYQTYESSFDFAGSLTTVIIEIGGRDINLAIGPIFSNVSLEILYNTINTIISQEITTVEMFVALNIDAPEEIINIVEDIFDSNDMVDTDEGMTMEPIEMEEVTYETVETEMAEMIEMEMPEIEIEVAEIEIEIEAEIEAEIETTVEETTPPKLQYKVQVGVYGEGEIPTKVQQLFNRLREDEGYTVIKEPVGGVLYKYSIYKVDDGIATTKAAADKLQELSLIHISEPTRPY